MNELSRRIGRRFAGVTLAGFTLAGCNIEPPVTEVMPTYDVPLPSSVDPSRLSPPRQSDKPPAAEAPPAVASFTVCFGAFVDYARKNLIVNPLVAPTVGENRDAQDFTPLLARFDKQTGDWQINRRSRYEPGQYDWLNTDGETVGGRASDCRKVPVKEIQIVQLEADTPGTATPVLASPDVDKNQIIDIWQPGDAETSGVYHLAYPFADVAQLQAYQRSMRAAS